MSDLNFEKLGKIGQGQYGVVYKARMVATGHEVALKRILIDEYDGIPSTALREVSLLQDLKHQNIVKLIDVLHVDAKFYLVFELLEMDLGQLLKSARPDVFPIEVTKSLFKQLIEGLYYCHSRRILHRDIKPQNLLLSSEGVLKLADFGLARLFSLPLRALTTEVVTLWYRPPEVLFADDFYSVGADVWSSGCVLVELLLGKTLFQGDCEIGQIHEIFQRLGTPDDESWPGFSRSPLFRNSFPDWKRQSASELYPGVCLEACELLDCIFIYDQGKRISSKHILKSEFLKNVSGSIPLRHLKELYRKEDKQKTKVDPT